MAEQRSGSAFRMRPPIPSRRRWTIGSCQDSVRAGREKLTDPRDQLIIQQFVGTSRCIHRLAHHMNRAQNLMGNGMTATPMTAAMVSAALKTTASKINPADADPFREGDAVVYPTHGLGRIDGVGFEDIAGYTLDLILISFDENQMTLRVPVAQARAAGLRKLASQNELADALVTLKGRPRVSRLMWAKRAQGYLAKINSGDLGALAEVVRDLQTTEEGSGRSFSQRNLFETALERLAAEFAAINEVTKVEAVCQLSQALLDARAALVTQVDHRPVEVQA
jgi:CarD family transcriptional regulator